MFAFTNKDRDRVKNIIMGWDRVLVLPKRLENGQFSWPTYAGDKKISMEPTALMMLMAEIDLLKGSRKAWFER
jgi:transposase